MGHKALGTTQTYYRVTEHRIRGAVDKIVQFHRHGARIWKDAKALLDHEHARMRVGAVAVPFGTCTEPSNVSAGGHACPFRFRCLGCGHFRTDPSYLPELRDYMQTLLRNRERILAATDLDEWAADEATPSEDEITRLRALRLAAPPPWLAAAIAATTATLGRYPRPAAAVAAIARRHQRLADQVLLTAVGAEAFTLLARALTPRQAVVVHPQFTEPEAALLTAGHAVTRVLLQASDRFLLHPDLVPEGADLVMIGNPTNPTGTLHPADLIRGLVRPGRVVVVDEAFIDAIPGDAESLVAEQVPGLLVIRSLTKTWGIAGLRAGYVLGDPDLGRRLAAHQPPWSVSGSPALAAIQACCSDRARQEAEAAARVFTAHRRVLVDGLADLGLPVAGTPRTPFVLVDTISVIPAGRSAGYLRDIVRDNGFAVRRGDTFPGLGPEWVRIAVREPAGTRRLLQSIAMIRVAERVG